MKILVFVLVMIGVLSPIICGVAGFRAGLRVGERRQVNSTLASIGVPANLISRYQDVMRILNAMINGVDLDGSFAGNILTERTRQEISCLVDQYRKEVGVR